MTAPGIEAGKPIRFFSGQRILVRQLISRKSRLQAVYSEEEFLTNQSGQSLIPRNTNLNIKSIVAILNSRLISWFFCQVNMVARRDDFPKTIIKPTRALPFPAIDFNKLTDKPRHDDMVSLVERMLQLQKRSPARAGNGETCPWESTKDNKIESTDRAIDRLVYELYGLSPDEIRIVEGNE